MAKKTKKKRHIILKLILSLILIGIILYLYATYIEPKIIKVNDYKITNQNITDNFDGFKIVHLSDIHYGKNFNLKDLKKLVKKINKQNPDIVAITGDLLDKHTKLTNTEVEKISKELDKIDAICGKYIIKGNHDTKFDEWTTIIKNGGFIDLNNTYDTIYKNGYNFMMIAGISSFDDKESIINKNQKNQNYLNTFEKNGPIYKILLMHEPDYINDLEENPYDLILAGHSHGGFIKIPFIGGIYKVNGAKTYTDGHYKLKNSDLYVSNGIGLSLINFRLFNTPSFNVYKLSK